MCTKREDRERRQFIACCFCCCNSQSDHRKSNQEHGPAWPLPPVCPLLIRVLLGEPGDGVDDDEEYAEEDDDKDGHLPPVALKVGHDAGLAGLAIVAELAVVVAPDPAVGVGGDVLVGPWIPRRRVPEAETALPWWLAAAGLEKSAF